MTALTRVSAREMKRRTGFGKALGYSFPEKDEILIRDDLPKDLEKEVLAHEEEHIERGEEGPFLDFLANIFGSSKQAREVKRATDSQTKAAADQLAFAKEAQQQQQENQQHFIDASKMAMPALLSLVGLGGGTALSPRERRAVPWFEQTPADGGMPAYKRHQLSQMRQSAYSRASGGNTIDGEYYNINELGPESFYAEGEYTRTPYPKTVTGKSGYVQPNIRGRALGGMVGEPTGYRDMVPRGGPPNRPPATPIQQPPIDTTSVDPNTGYPRENPGGVEGGYNFMTEPGYQFRFSEGMRALDRGAAARGGLLSGGYARKAIRYGQGFASNEFANVYNRIANIAGLGQTSATQAGQQGMYGAALMGNAASNAGYARASGHVAQGDIWGNAIQSAGNWAQDTFGDKIGDWWKNRGSGGGSSGGSSKRGYGSRTW